MEDIRAWIDRARAFEHEAHAILGKHEASASRAVLLEQSYVRLTGLSLNQDELLREAFRCVEEGLFRAAHVLAWAGFMDFLEEKLASDGFVKLNQARPKWQISTIEDLREYPDFQIIEVAHAASLCSKGDMRILHGKLSGRNECAHPSGYRPDANDTLGYVSNLLHMIAKLKAKAY